MIQGQKNDNLGGMQNPVSGDYLTYLQHADGQPPRKNAVSSLGLKGKNQPNELSVLGQRNGAITGLNLVSPTSNYIVGDINAGSKSSMAHTNQH